MGEATVAFVTNRDPISKRSTIVDFGQNFHREGVGELRFGLARVTYPDDTAFDDAKAVDAFVNDKDTPLSVEVFSENVKLEKPKLGSEQLFNKLRTLMVESGRDSLVYLHGYSTSFRESLATGFALQWYLRSKKSNGPPVNVIVFTWPSDDSLVPWKAYKSDRQDARATGPAFGRAFLKLRDFLAELPPEQACRRKIHLLCHSMGNYVLQNAMQIIGEYHGGTYPRIFDQIAMLAPDVDADVFEHADALGRLHEATRRISVYINDRDTALLTSDVTKGNPERLGLEGPANRTFVPDKVEVVDCSYIEMPRVSPIYHHYHLEMRVLADIANSLSGRPGDMFVGSERGWSTQRMRWYLK